MYKRDFLKTYGPLTEGKKDDVRKLIRCGKFQNGFVRHTCYHCGTMLVVPFTCKSRLCLSCSRKKLFGWSLNLSHVMNTSLNHSHITLTMPGQLSQLLFERNYETSRLIPLAAGVIKSFMKKTAGYKEKNVQPGILATLHKSGNSLNYNPHVHCICTKELVDTQTGEIITPGFLNYHTIRMVWQKALLKQLLKQNTITAVEYQNFQNRYPHGFHVHFQRITGNENDILFRTAEYIATGYFHNSQITAINHEKKTITFKYRKSMERGTRKKHYAEMTLGIYEFMARMLYYLPDHHRKMIRYYGIYANGLGKKLKEAERDTWVKAVENSFEAIPTLCPFCGVYMISDTVFALRANEEIKKIVKTHTLRKGYFVPNEKRHPT